MAGTGAYGYSGDGGPATSAAISPGAIAVDSLGNLYLEDNGNVRVRKITQDGIIITIAGNGTAGYSGDGGPATSAQLTMTAGIAVGGTGNVYVTCSSGTSPWNFGNFAIRLLQPLTSTTTTAQNAASNLSGPVSPGEVIVLYGSNLGPAKLTQYHVDSSGLVDCQLAGTTVQVNGACAPIIYTSSTQVAAIVPYSVSGSTAQVTVTYQGQTTAAGSLPVAPSAPGLFTLDSTGKGPAAAVNQDGTINSAATPAKSGDVILLYATGEGQTTPSGADGKPAAVPLPQPNLPVTVTIGGQNVKPQYAGGAPGEVAGVMQINVQVPSGIQHGNAVPVLVQVGAVSSQAGVTIAVR